MARQAHRNARSGDHHSAMPSGEHHMLPTRTHACMGVVVCMSGSWFSCWKRGQGGTAMPRQRTSMHRQNSGQLLSPMRPEQGQMPLQQMYLRYVTRDMR